ncbi:MAG: cytochrome c [Myxococcota bacterium]
MAILWRVYVLSQEFRERRKRSVVWFGWALCLLFIFAACAMPGRLYPVAPELQVELRGVQWPGEQSELRLNVVNRDVPSLFEVQRIRLADERRLRFRGTQLAVAGREFNSRYRVFLHYRVGSEDRVIWRSEYSRNEWTNPAELDCDLRRPARLGQPCRMRDSVEYPWRLVQGRETYEALCAACHGDEGRGGGGVQTKRDSAPSEEPAAPNLREIAKRRPGGFDRDEIAEWIEGSLVPRAHGSSKMPIWGERLSLEYERYSNADDLVGARLDPLIVYLMSIQEE